MPMCLSGYGIGQLGSLYMCGTLTAEQAIQAAYHVGKTLDKTGHLASTYGNWKLSMFCH